MGRPKAWLPWFGRPLIEHVVGQVAPAVDEVVVVTSEELDLPPIDARIVCDREPALGPLAGIREGLEAAGADWVFVTSTDAPFVTPDFVRSLLSHERAVAPVSEGFVQVLSAVYPGSAWREADRILARASDPAADRKTARPVALLESLGFERLDADRFAEPYPWQGFNSPDDYLRCARHLDRDAAAEIELLGLAAAGLEETRFRTSIGRLGEVLEALPEKTRRTLVDEGRISKRHLVSLSGRELVRDLALPVGPGERVSVIDALAGG